MALFGSKKTKEETKDQPAHVTETAVTEVKTPVSTRSAQATDRNLDGIIIKPYITEKSVMAGERNVYTFEVSMRATKRDVRDAIIKVFGVTPVKVNIVKKAPGTRESRMRARAVKVSGMKKAYVYLKEGDSISFV